jgi:hypothetical protein
MGHPSTVEDRLEALEREVAELKRHLIAPREATPNPNWLQSFVGSQPDPEFDEVIRLGREARAAYRQYDDDVES